MNRRAVQSVVWMTATSLCLVACGITAPVRNAGYADFDSLGSRGMDQTMTLSLGPSLLKIAAMGLDDNPEVRRLVRNLDGVRVRTYDVVGDPGQVGSGADGISANVDESCRRRRGCGRSI